jgi:two-component system CheB/CheR fusion protein
VTWRIYDTGSGKRLAWEWKESGVPVLNTAPTRHGFGRDLIERGLPYQLGATSALEFGPGGIRCAIELSLTERVVFSSETLISDPTGKQQEE